MLLPVILVLLCILCAALFVFAYMLDKWQGVACATAFAVWIAFTVQPVHAQDTIPSDDSWPSINDDQLPVLVGHNMFGDKIVLFANFCNGDGARRDHMHTYGIYNGHNMFIQGGCWQWNPAQLKATHTIAYFDLNGGGWDKWPLSSFHVAKTLPH